MRLLIKNLKGPIKKLPIEPRQVFQVALAVTEEFKTNSWNPLVSSLGSKISTSEILKQAIRLRCLLECDDAEIFIRHQNGTEDSVKKFLGIE